MKNNGFKMGTLFGTVLGASLGVLFGTKLGPLQKRRIMKNINRAKYSLKNGIDSIWG